MNKYQVALDFLCDNSKLTQFNIGESQWASETLQELVDKATPKKPLEIIFNNFGMGERIGRCPNCKILVNQFQTHCKCDQKLDWSKDE